MKRTNFIILLALQLLMLSNANAAASNNFETLPWSPKIISTTPGNATISGRVLDQNGTPVPSAYVIIVETGTGTFTTVNGYYVLRMPPGTYTIQIGFLGCNTMEAGITVASDVSYLINATLQCVFLNNPTTDTHINYRKNLAPKKNLVLEVGAATNYILDKSNFEVIF